MCFRENTKKLLNQHKKVQFGSFHAFRQFWRRTTTDGGQIKFQLPFSFPFLLLFNSNFIYLIYLIIYFIIIIFNLISILFYFIFNLFNFCLFVDFAQQSTPCGHPLPPCRHFQLLPTHQSTTPTPTHHHIITSTSPVTSPKHQSQTVLKSQAIFNLTASLHHQPTQLNPRPAYCLHLRIQNLNPNHPQPNLPLSQPSH